MVDKKFAIALLRGILNLSNDLKISDYSVIKSYLETEMKVVGYLTLKKVIDEFDIQNLTLFCHPRSTTIRLAF